MMKSNHKLIFTTFLIICSFQKGFSQNSEKLSRWEIGVDALSLIDQNELPPYSLFGRLLLNPEGKKQTHLRTRIGFERLNLLDSAFYYGSIGLDYRITSFFASVGIQKEIMAFPKGALYVGGDVGFSRAVDIKEWTDAGTTGREGFDNFTETKWRLSGILGYTHQLGRNFAISLESSLQGTNTKQNWDKDYINFVAGGPEPEIVIEQKSIETWETKVQPFYQLLLSYRF